MQRDCFYTKAGKILEGSEYYENMLIRSLLAVTTLPDERLRLWSLPPLALLIRLHKRVLPLIPFTTNELGYITQLSSRAPPARLLLTYSEGAMTQPRAAGRPRRQ